MTVEARRERKVISVVFADLVGFTARSEALDPEDVEAFLHPYHRLLRTELERFGGTVEKFIGDAVVAIFGAPATHEDDPERAVRAALAIRDAVVERGDLEVRIAVNTGEAIVWVDVRAATGEGMATGDVLNTASRLQAVAPVNGVLVGEATYRATRDTIEYEPVDPVVVKGKAEAVPVWVAIEARSRFGSDVRQHSDVPLVGRTRERSMLVDALDRVESERSPQLVTLVGVPGIGKSRLVYELFGEVDRRPEFQRWRAGRSLPYGAGVPFWALTEIVKAEAGILEGDGGSVAAEKLAEAVRRVVPADEQAWVTGWLAPVVGLEAPTVLQGDRQSEVFTAWRRFLEGLAEDEPLVLVFEDLHWADDGLLDFVEHIVQWASGVAILVLCTARPELLERRPRWGGGALNALTLALSPLTDDEIARLLALVLEEAALAPETERLLVERVSGNPLYAEQFARLLRERGTIDGLVLPESVHGLIAARLDALTVTEKSLLQDAAVMGKVFWSGCLLDGADTADVLQGLVRKEFIRRERRSSVAGEDEYAFRHVLVRDVAYGQIPKAERAARHLRAAAWIEGLGRPEDHADLVAHHVLTALDLVPAPPDDLRSRAAAAARLAGERAAGLHAHAAAIGFFERALALTAPDDPARPRLLYELGRAHHRTSEMAGQHLEDALVALDAAGEAELAAEVATMLVREGWSRGDRADWTRRLDRLMDRVAPLPPSPPKAFAIATRARLLMLAGDHAQASEAATAAIEMSRSLGLDDWHAHALNSLAAIRYEEGDDQALDLMRDAIKLARAANSPDLHRALNNMEILLTMDGRLAEARGYRKEADEAVRRFGAGFGQYWSEVAAVGTKLEDGQWDEALASSARLLEDIGAPYLESELRTGRAFMQTVRGDLDGGIEELRLGLESAERVGDPQVLFPALAVAAAVYVERGESDAARRHLLRLLEARRDVTLPFAGPSFVVDAFERSGLAVEFFEAMRGRRVTGWMRAAEASLAGDLARAVAIYEAMPSSIDAAFARMRHAEQLAGQGRHQEAGDVLELAIVFFRRAGATRWLARVDALR